MWYRLPAAALLVMALSACEHGDPLVDEGGGLEPTLESIQTNIFSTSCALSGCHIGNDAPRGLDLSAGNARENLVDVASGGVPGFLRVNPGNADDSYLVLKLEGDERIVGSRMPLNMPPLSSMEIGVIREWINSGAP